MMWLKACPRCGGDLFMDSDYYGHFVCCIQCGVTLDKSQQTALQRRFFIETPPEPSRSTMSLRAADRRVA